MTVVFRTLESPFSKANELAVCQYVLDFAEKSLSRINSVFSEMEDLQKCEKEDPYGIPFALSQLRIQVSWLFEVVEKGIGPGKFICE